MDVFRSGPSNDDKKLPLVHPLSPCSHLGGARRSQGTPSVDDILHADRLRLQSLSETGTYSSAASTSDSIPIAGNDYDEFPGTLFYTVSLGYGTPAQQFTVTFDTAAGFSYLRCKPCKAGDSPCDTAFDPSLSSSFAPIPCGSPECAGSCSGQTTCPFRFGNSVFTEANGTVVKDTLTLSPSATVEGFTFGCTEFVEPWLYYGAAGMIDLSKNNRSVASRAVSSSPPSGSDDSTIAFSYCLPSNLSSPGFLSVSPSRSVYSGRQDVQYAPLVDNTAMPVFYFVELVGINVGGIDLQIPPSVPINNFTLIDMSTTFTYFFPPVYAVLREEFQRQMANYSMVASPFIDLDTCYNFTGLTNEVVFLPIIRLEFAGGSSLELEFEQVMYFTNPANYYSVACLAFGETSPENTFPVSVIGNLAQMSAEMIYDVQGGKLGFAQGVC
ncbi:Aspartyl protease family protein [Dichanthelium oligosanthes]|uniref:Aspartyl protease family protein n=1 Tax=Dichanthelium oligosanthes TaxID=888268 RepID=A0A1E5W9R6_9POAL|nr:Aspartyl protease family protein [Dichanthelium oligosanthes]